MFRWCYGKFVTKAQEMGRLKMTSQPISSDTRPAVAYFDICKKMHD